MPDRSFLRWPFFEERHRALAEQLETWAAQHCAHVDHRDVDAACRKLVRELGRDGWLKHTASGEVASDTIDVRTLALIRETLASHSGLADFAFAMQGLGAGPISLFCTPAQKAHWLPKTRSGVAIAAFALSEPASGSDVANISMTARRNGDGFILDGEKTWISNGGIADLYVVFARTGEAAGAGIDFGDIFREVFGEEAAISATGSNSALQDRTHRFAGDALSTPSRPDRSRTSARRDPCDPTAGHCR